jgi:hypothetical protein
VTVSQLIGMGEGGGMVAQAQAPQPAGPVFTPGSF